MTFTKKIEALTIKDDGTVDLKEVQMEYLKESEPEFKKLLEVTHHLMLKYKLPPEFILGLALETIDPSAAQKL